jgi:hypothetical protein
MKIKLAAGRRHNKRKSAAGGSRTIGSQNAQDVQLFENWAFVNPNESEMDMPFGICLFHPAHNMLSRRINKPLNKCVFDFRSKTLIMEV